MRAAVAALALLPAVAAAQVRIESIVASTGSVLGRVCQDLDGDGRCSPGEPGVAGALLVLDGGQVALADAEGRYHFLDVPARIFQPGRSGYGGHVLALDLAAGETRVRRLFDLAPGGAVRLDLAVPAGASPRQGSALGRAARPPAQPPRLEGGRLRWVLSGRAPPRSRVEVNGVPASTDGDGNWYAPVDLAPGQNLFGLAVWEPDGRVSLHRQAVQRARRHEGGDLVVPLAPEWLATVALPPDGVLRGHQALVRGIAAAGVEVRVAGALARPGPSGLFEARPALEPGEGTLALAAQRGDASVQAAMPIRFERGGATVVALADLELSGGREGARLAGRGAVTARGVIGPVEGEAGIDLDDRERRLDALWHARDVRAVERQASPESSFPVSGDDAAAGDSNPQRGRIYAHVRAPGARLDLGGTRSGITGRELGRYDRAFVGAKVAGERTLGPLQLEASAFGSSARPDAGQAGVPAAAHDALAATGGSLYFLRHLELVVGSEALRVEWRDPITARVVAQRTLVRTVDYQIDYAAGRVILAAPLPTVGGPPALSTGDPLFAATATLVVDYLYASPDGADDVAGGRLGASLGPLRLDGAAASEERGGSRYRLLAGGAALDLGALLGRAAGEAKAKGGEGLGDLLRLRAEMARSQGAAFRGADGWSGSLDGGLSFGSPPAPGGEAATAWQVEGRGGAGGARYAGWWRERPAGYSDGEYLQAVGALERGASASWAGGPASLEALWAERRGADPRDPSGLAVLDARDARGRAGWRWGEARLGAEVLSTRAEAREGRGRQLGAGLRADWAARADLGLHAAWHQSLSREGEGPAARDSTYFGAGAALSLPDGSLGAEAGWGPGLGPRLLVGGEKRSPDGTTYGTFSLDPDAPAFARQSVAAVGARRSADGAEVWSEDQFARDAFGLRASRVSGVSLQPLPGLRLTARAESGSRLELDGTKAVRWAVGGDLAWLSPRWRLGARAETREDGDRHQSVVGAAADWRATERLRFGGRATWARSSVAGEPGLAFEASLGGAWRGEAVQLVARVSATADQRPGEVRREQGSGSVACTVDVVSPLALGLSASYGANRLAGERVDLAAGSARGVLRLWGPFDVAAEYARREAVRGPRPDRLDAGRLEAGWSFAQGRLAAGYNLFGFSGTGVDPGADGDRVYLRAELAY